jgi:hypothetical protein
VYDFAEPEREIGDHVCGGDDFPDWKIRDGRQSVGMKLERTVEVRPIWVM